MRAAYIDGPGGEIRCGPLPDPVPGPTDVLVDVLTGTVNPVDTFVRAGTYAVPMTLPFVVGRDAVGRVAESTMDFTAGELVWTNSLGHGGRQGATAERAVVPAERLYRLPPGIGPEAVTVLHPTATAHLALHTHGRVRPGETVVVLGAAGNVGSALVTVAVEAGARVVASASPADAGYCGDLGADLVLDYAKAPPRALKADLWIDCSGHNDVATAVDRLAERGRIVLLAGTDARPELPAGPLYLKSASIHGFVISRATIAELAAAAGTVNRLLPRGLRSRRTVTVPLDGTAEAYRRLEAGEQRARVIIEV